MGANYLSVIAILLVINSGYLCQDARYMVLLPKTVQQCVPYTISARAFGNHSYSLTATLEKRYPTKLVATSSFQILSGSTRTITLPIPCDLRSGSHYLKVVGTGETQFSRTQYLRLITKNVEIIIQTDKKVYKPGQTVKYRIFAVHPNLQVVSKNFTVTVKDPKGNKIIFFSAEGDDYSVVERNLKLSSEPVFGVWKITASVEGATHTQTFKIEKYVLPKAEANVILPSIVSEKDTSVTVQVSSQYTFDKPVNGSATLSIKIDYYPSSEYKKDPETGKYGHVPVTQPELIYEMQLDGNGKSTTVIPMEDLKKIAYRESISYRRIIAQVNVTEYSTGEEYISPIKTVSVSRSREKLNLVLNPQNYKPGLVNRIYIELKQLDGKPVLEPGNIIVEARVKIEEKEPPTTLPPPSPSPGYDYYMTPSPPPRYGPYRHYGYHGYHGYVCDYPQYRYKDLPQENLTVPANGLVAYDLFVNETDSVEVSLKVRYVKDTSVSVYRTLTAFRSPSNTFLSVSLKTNKPISGQNVELEVTATREFSKVYFTILSRGVLITEQYKEFSTANKTQILGFHVTSSMAPKLKVIVNIKVENKEIVADAISFNVEGFYNNDVSLSFDADKVETGSTSTLSVKAYRDSNVYAVAVDKSTTLLGEASDDISQDIEEFLDKAARRNSYRKKREAPLRKRRENERRTRAKRSVWWPYAYSTSGTDVEDMFRNTGLYVISDAVIYRYSEPQRCHGYRYRYGYTAMPMPMPEMAGTIPPAGMSFTLPPIGTTHALPPVGPEQPPTPSRNFDEEVSVRSFFPETWIWDSQNTGSQGIANFTFKVPDTITTWIASAFAISKNPSIGVGMTSDVAELTAFREFFVMLNLPYSVVRGEELVIKANVFNYLGFDTEVEVMLENPQGYVIIQVDAEGFEVESFVTETKKINVPKDGTATAYFIVRFVEVGYIDLQVYARTTTLLAGDRILKPMLVEVEGIPQEYNEVVIVDLVEQNYFNKSVEIRYPRNVVPDSQKVVVTAYGDPLGSALKDIERWIRMPSGCGEQNMIYFVPNIYIWTYLYCTGKLTPALKLKIKGYLETGYSGELRYQRNDFSFSAFGDSDSSGSQWLTAYVLRTFSEARQYIYVDETILKNAAYYLLRNMNPDGTFNEPGRVIHKELKGSSFEGDGLNAFTLIALSEVPDLISSSGLYYRTNLDKAISHLYNVSETMTNIYDLAITAYALYVSGKSDQSSVVLKKLESLQTTEDGMVYWEVVIEADRVKYYWNPPKKQSSPVNIETAAYVLLTYAKMREISKGIPVMKWLLSQQNSNGGYSTSQDTVVALQALSQFACLLHGGSYEITLNVFACRQIKTWTLSQNSPSSLFKWETSETTDSIDIEASGKGTGIVMVTVKYNIEELIVTSTWRLSVVTDTETSEFLIIKVCFEWSVENQSSGMAILEAGLISGFRLDDSQLQENKLIKRIESTQRKFNLYFDEVGNEPICLKLRLVKTEVVGKVKPAFVSITDYYNPENSATAPYKSSLGENVPVCALCAPGDCGECKVGKKR